MGCETVEELNASAYLRRRQVDEAREVLPLRGRQVLLLFEPSLQLVNLRGTRHRIVNSLKYVIQLHIRKLDTHSVG